MPLEDVGPSDSFAYRQVISNLSRQIRDAEDSNILDFIMSRGYPNFSTPNHDRSHLGPAPPQYEAVPRTRFERILDPNALR